MSFCVNKLLITLVVVLLLINLPLNNTSDRKGAHLKPANAGHLKHFHSFIGNFWKMGRLLDSPLISLNCSLSLLLFWAVPTVDSLKSLPALSVLINCTSSPIFKVISDCFFATQRTEHGQLLKAVSRSDKWLNPCAKAFYWRFNSHCIMNCNVFSPIANVHYYSPSAAAGNSRIIVTSFWRIQINRSILSGVIIWS